MTVSIKSGAIGSLLEGVVLPNANYPSVALAIADLAVALTKQKLAVEATGDRKHKALNATTKAARSLSNYRMIENGWLYEDAHLVVELTFNDGYVFRDKPRLFLDSDGVFASFETHVQAITGKTIAELGDEEMWKQIGHHERFWSEMPLLPGAEALWEAVKGANPIILTGCPKNAYDFAVASKRAWWLKYFGVNDITTCLSYDKALFIVHSNDILLDDTARNLKRWREAGGVGVLFKNNEQAIADLKRLGVI